MKRRRGGDCGRRSPAPRQRCGAPKGGASRDCCVSRALRARQLRLWPLFIGSRGGPEPGPRPGPRSGPAAAPSPLANHSAGPRTRPSSPGRGPEGRRARAQDPSSRRVLGKRARTHGELPPELHRPAGATTSPDAMTPEINAQSVRGIASMT
ncbi:unnamed protein product [Ixodes pacificus]